MCALKTAHACTLLIFVEHIITSEIKNNGELKRVFFVSIALLLMPHFKHAWKRKSSFKQICFKESDKGSAVGEHDVKCCPLWEIKPQACAGWLSEEDKYLNTYVIILMFMIFPNVPKFPTDVMKPIYCIFGPSHVFTSCQEQNNISTAPTILK